MIKIKLDKRNTNLHTDAGLQLLDKSIDKVGIIESYTISNDGVVISGNARHEKISAKITKEPIVIETDGTEAIIIKRTDIESNTKKFHEASILANTTAHKNFNLDYDVIDEIAEEFDIDIDEMGIKIKEELNAMELFNIEIPFYTPSKEIPKIEDLAYTEKTKSLLKKIEKTNLPKDVKEILNIRASFFTDFNFDKIADFYDKQDDSIKELMKSLGMVIIAPKEALNNGFVEIKEEIFDI
jgi:hypothetical protein